LRLSHALSGEPLKVNGSTREDGISLSLDTQFGLLGHGLSFPSTNSTFGGRDAQDKTPKSTAKVTKEMICKEGTLFIALFPKSIDALTGWLHSYVPSQLSKI